MVEVEVDKVRVYIADVSCDANHGRVSYRGYAVPSASRQDVPLNAP